MKSPPVKSIHGKVMPSPVKNFTRSPPWAPRAQKETLVAVPLPGMRKPPPWSPQLLFGYCQKAPAHPYPIVLGNGVKMTFQQVPCAFGLDRLLPARGSTEHASRLALL